MPPQQVKDRAGCPELVGGKPVAGCRRDRKGRGIRLKNVCYPFFFTSPRNPAVCRGPNPTERFPMKGTKQILAWCLATVVIAVLLAIYGLPVHALTTLASFHDLKMLPLMGAITLVEAAKLAANEGKVIRASVISMFARASNLLMALPFKDIQGNAYQYNREQVLPGVAFRGVNEAYAASTGVINQLVEALRIAGGDLDVDTFIIKTQGMQVRSTHEEMKVKSLAAELTRVLIKGDSTSNPREFDGLQNRLVGGQLIEAGATNGGDALSLLKLDELIDAVPGTNALVMNKAMRRRLTAAARDTTVGGFVTYEKDAFGRRLTVYNDIPILVSYENNDGTDPLAFDEVGVGGATATATSIYAIAFGDGLVTGLQAGGMDVRDLGELETEPKYRTRVEWFPGLCVEHGRAAGRLRGISNAAVVK